MMNRLIKNQSAFLGCLMAAVGSWLLVACGGQGLDPAATRDGGGNPSVAGAGATTAANGTIASPGAPIVDLVGNVWTISKVGVYRNGVKDDEARNVAMLFIYGNAIYRKDTNGEFYQWMGSAWQTSGNPHAVDTAAAVGTGSFGG